MKTNRTTFKKLNKVISESKQAKVFLGGTCNGLDYRNTLIPQLKINYFNPIVDNWDEAAYQEELKQRENCDYCLYVITPEMAGFYSIAEVIDDSNKRPDKTIFCYLPQYGNKPFSSKVLKSLKAVATLVQANGGTFCRSLSTVAKKLNQTK